MSGCRVPRGGGLVHLAGFVYCLRCWRGNQPLFFSFSRSAEFAVGLCTRDSWTGHNIMAQTLIQLAVQQSISGGRVQVISAIGNLVLLQSADEVWDNFPTLLKRVAEILAGHRLAAWVQSDTKGFNGSAELLLLRSA